MRVLVADDDAVTQMTLELLLTCAGHQVVLASTGALAFHALVADEAIQLALLDGSMPELAGAEVCRRIRALAPERALFVTLLTGHQAEEDRRYALEAGVDLYLVKPYRDSDILNAVNRASSLGIRDR